MIRILIRTVVYLISAALGLLVATWILDDMHVHAGGFLLAVVIFAAAQLILSPFIVKFVRRNAEAFLGGVGLVSTFVALLLANLLGSDGIEIHGIPTWIGATVITWLVTALGTLFVPFLLAKAGIEHARENRADSAR
ncbi:phage holin family protein [Gordonia hankookensis]|uniref:Phage holin family protein n=1 Tax=Gordonia hankookensis TaxID=589403 RepID=A0ABR7W8L6_9ACTN|nr:phage holin family protein [Gordonia hankookensis]MBD1318177.1 phage holin family protein [Gordonia hankookensis]